MNERAKVISQVEFEKQEFLWDMVTKDHSWLDRNRERLEEWCVRSMEAYSEVSQSITSEK